MQAVNPVMTLAPPGGILFSGLITKVETERYVVNLDLVEQSHRGQGRQDVIRERQVTRAERFKAGVEEVGQRLHLKA